MTDRQVAVELGRGTAGHIERAIAAIAVPSHEDLAVDRQRTAGGNADRADAAIASDVQFIVELGDGPIAHVQIAASATFHAQHRPVADMQGAAGFIDRRSAAPAPEQTAMIAGVIGDIQRAVHHIDRGHRAGGVILPGRIKTPRLHVQRAAVHVDRAIGAVTLRNQEVAIGHRAIFIVAAVVQHAAVGDIQGAGAVVIGEAEFPRKRIEGGTRTVNRQRAGGAGVAGHMDFAAARDGHSAAEEHRLVKRAAVGDRERAGAVFPDVELGIVVPAMTILAPVDHVKRRTGAIDGYMTSGSSSPLTESKPPVCVERAPIADVETTRAAVGTNKGVAGNPARGSASINHCARSVNIQRARANPTAGTDTAIADLCISQHIQIAAIQIEGAQSTVPPDNQCADVQGGGAGHVGHPRGLPRVSIVIDADVKFVDG